MKFRDDFSDDEASEDHASSTSFPATGQTVQQPSYSLDRFNMSAPLPDFADLGDDDFVPAGFSDDEQCATPTKVTFDRFTEPSVDTVVKDAPKPRVESAAVRLFSTPGPARHSIAEQLPSMTPAPARTAPMARRLMKANSGLLNPTGAPMTGVHVKPGHRRSASGGDISDGDGIAMRPQVLDFSNAPALTEETPPPKPALGASFAAELAVSRLFFVRFIVYCILYTVGIIRRDD